jgi:hypothetical protein
MENSYAVGLAPNESDVWLNGDVEEIQIRSTEPLAERAAIIAIESLTDPICETVSVPARHLHQWAVGQFQRNVENDPSSQNQAVPGFRP